MRINKSNAGKARDLSPWGLPLLALYALLFASLVSCEMYGYGRLGGADRTETLYPSDLLFQNIMASMSGVWYSHNAGFGRLDGYRIGKWGDFKTLVEDSGKDALFPGLQKETCAGEGGTKIPVNGDYFVFYDDTVFGQSGDGTGGNGGWGALVTRYIGIVRAVNIFNGDKGRGAVIIEYLINCAPRWDNDLKDGSHPFFGIYYRVLDGNTVQMANAVDLAAWYNGKKYYTETAALDEAVSKNTIENEAEFISWGVVVPQSREN
jgi:hypothetical protein